MGQVKEEHVRTAKLIGESGVDKLSRKSVIIFGVGGVGSFAAEAIARAGMGKITLVDHDIVAKSNINRQLIALNSTLGKLKTDVMVSRIRDINPDADISGIPEFFTEENKDSFNIEKYGFVLDCIDSVPSKIALIKLAKEKNVPIISAMGAGNRLCPEKFEISDISKTSYCRLARAVRQKLKKEGIEHLTVVFSKEPPIQREGTPGSISFVPSSAGLLMASFVIKELIK